MTQLCKVNISKTKQNKKQNVSILWNILWVSCLSRHVLCGVPKLIFVLGLILSPEELLKILELMLENVFRHFDIYILISAIYMSFLFLVLTLLDQEKILALNI